MKIEIVFKNSDFIVINKPSGVVVNKAATVKEGTIQDWAEEKLGFRGQGLGFREKTDFVRRAGVVHRLDKETSGLLVIAKNLEAFENLQAQFKTRKVKKKYLGLAHGKVEPEEGRIKLPISRSPFDREKFGVFPGGRRAETHYSVISNYSLRKIPSECKLQTMKRPKVWFKVSNFTLLEVTPLTGRTHQIRVHLKYIGHPVVADIKYAGRKTSRTDRIWCPRMFLHASSLGFSHPRTQKWIEFKARLPADLKLALEKLKKQDGSP